MNRSQSSKIRNGRRRHPLPALGVFLLAALTACGREPASQAGGGDAGGKRAAGGSGVVPAEKVASCAGFTAGKAAQFLSLPAADVKDSSQNLYAKLRMCSFARAQDSSSALTFSLRSDESVEEATVEMARLRENAGVAQGAIAGATNEEAKGPAYEEVSGLGDEAIWIQVNGSLNVRKGNVSILVMAPSDRATQKRLAELVVAGLS